LEGELDRMLAEAMAPPLLLHPSLSEIYRTRIHSLSEALSREEMREETAQVVRALASAIELTPETRVLPSHCAVI
jgi:site-specific DNA recombinase